VVGLTLLSRPEMGRLFAIPEGQLWRSRVDGVKDSRRSFLQPALYPVVAG
jgi:hypothetical protein